MNYDTIKNQFLLDTFNFSNTLIKMATTTASSTTDNMTSDLTTTFIQQRQTTNSKTAPRHSKHEQGRATEKLIVKLKNQDLRHIYCLWKTEETNIYAK